jgi:hypothetical protein
MIAFLVMLVVEQCGRKLHNQKGGDGNDVSSSQIMPLSS